MSIKITRTAVAVLAVTGTAALGLPQPGAAAAAPTAAAVEQVNKYWDTNASGAAGVSAWGWQKVDSKDRDVIWGYVKDTAPRDGKRAKVVFKVTYLGGSSKTYTTTAPASGKNATVGTYWFSNPARVQVRECAAKCGKNWTIYSGYGGPINRGTVLTRARDWAKRGVPYNQQGAAYDINKGRTYRTDCSGFISMTWGLTSSRNTETLKSVSRSVAWGKLKPGDMVLKGTGPWAKQHVKLFEKWANKKRTTMWIYEQGSAASDMNHNKVTVSSLKKNGYVPRAYKNIR